MRSFSTLRLKSTGAAVLSVTDLRQIPPAIQYARARKLKVVPLGEGSNVVLPVFWKVLCLRIQLRGIKKIRETADAVHIRVAAGEKWHDLVRYCTDKEWFGLENLALIPGSCGAAPIQNIGAYGSEIKEFLTRVHLIKRQDGTSKIVRAAECDLQYRTSCFKRSRAEAYIVTAIELKLSKTPNINLGYQELQKRLQDLGIDSPRPRDLFNAVCHLRTAKLPSTEVLGNVGSFFQNPTVSTSRFREIAAVYPSVKGYQVSPARTRIAAASLLEVCGWKGFRAGDIGVYEKHALCLVNYGNADQKMITDLAEKMRADVRNRFAIPLEIEPRVYA